MAAVENIMEFNLDIVNGVQYVDLNQCASLVSRKLIRQGEQVAIQNIEFFAVDAATINIYKLPAAWYACNAWVKAYSVWQRQQHEAIEEQDSVKATWRDFKVGMGGGQFTISKDYDENGNIVGAGSGTTRVGFAANLLPLWAQKEIQGSLGVVTTEGVDYEWMPSEIVMPSTDTVARESFNLHMVGVDAAATTVIGSKGIISGYGDSRARPQSPDPDAPDTNDVWMTEVFDLGDNFEGVIENVRENNANPPYLKGTTTSTSTAYEYYPGGSKVANSVIDWPAETVILNATNNWSVGATGSFVANLGLLYIENTSTANPITMRITLATDGNGNYLNRSMKEAN